MIPLQYWRALLPKARRRLSMHPNVAGVGLGLAEGARPARPVWRVYVRGEVPANGPLAGGGLPRTILGLETEVHCASPAHPSAGKVYTAGIWIESKIPGSFLKEGPHVQGSLGCFAQDNSGKRFLLTNSHVMFPMFIARPHLGMFQPDYSSCCGGDKIATPEFDSKEIKDGKFKGGFKTQRGDGYVPAPNEKGFTKERNLTCSLTDCAIATLDPGVTFKNVLPAPDGEIAITGVNDDVLSVLGPEAGTMPKDDQYVRVFTPRDGGKLIFGTLAWRKTTEITVDSIKVDEGTPNERRITPIFDTAFVDGSLEQEEAKGSVPAVNQFVILPRPKPIPGESDYRKFYNQPNLMLSFDHSDSGSVVIDSQGRVIAQIVRGFPFLPTEFVQKREQQKLIEFTKVGNVAIASPIRGIIAQLNITIPKGGFSGTIPSAGAKERVFVSGFSEDPELAAQRRGVERLRDQLRASRRGKLILGKITQHRREIGRLLTEVREITAAWRQFGGAAFYHHCVRAARNPEHVIPHVINGVNRERLFKALLPLFVRHGSPTLRKDVERYGARAIAAQRQISRIDDVPKAMAARWPRT